MHLDQYYTTPLVIEWAYKILKPRLGLVETKLVVDVTAGYNQFVPCFPKPWNTFASDIDPPKGSRIRKADFRHITTKDLKGQTGGVFGFNPPFGPKCQLGIEVALHGIEIQRPEILVLILTSAGARRRIPGYTLVERKVVPKNAFVRDNTPYHCPAFLCILMQSKFKPVVAEDLKREMTPFKRDYIRAIYDPQRHFTTSPTIWVVRRSGNNCGYHGFVRKDQIWYPYRFGSLNWIPSAKPDLSGQWVAVDLQKWRMGKERIEHICETLYDTQKQRKRDGLRFMSLGMEQVDDALKRCSTCVELSSAPSKG